jgi:hypothetical protein
MLGDSTAAQALQQAARDPKKIIWYEGDHLGKTSDLDEDLTMRVLTDALAFLKEVDGKIQSEVNVAETQ